MTMRTTRWTLTVAALLVCGAALADLPRLPKELNIPKGGDSPGQVVFRHDSHVDSKRPSCVPCHPQRFSILGKNALEKRAVLKHETMEKGQACGGCHGKEAFGFKDCENCHSTK